MLLRWMFVVTIALCIGRPACGQAVDALDPLSSPDGAVRLTLQFTDGRPAGRVAFRGTDVCSLAFGLQFAGERPIRDSLKIVAARRQSHDETYLVPVGKTSSARDHHQELVLTLQEQAAPNRTVELAFRAFEDGLAFRYQLPAQEPLASFELEQELTELTFSDDAIAHLLPLNGYTTSYEKHYETRPVSQVGPQTLIGLPLLVHRPLEGNPLWIGVTEANLIDYAGLYLAEAEGRPGTLAARLSPLPGRRDGLKVSASLPHSTPWRVLLLGDDPGRLIESNLVFHLSEPSKIADPSWIRPGRTTFPWWNGYVLEGADFQPGVNTATMKRYIDFCAEQGIEYHSLDGLDVAWYGGPIAPNGPTDITTAVPEIDLPDVLDYAKRKGVRLRLWMHWIALQRQLDEALPVYEQWGIEGIMVDFMDRDDQEMVAWYHEVAEKCAKHRLTVTWHGAYKPVGMERTWPNVLTSEAALNQEYNKWEGLGTPPEHNLNIAFIRMLAGPLDYHQGGMRSVLPADHRPRNDAPFVQGTRGHQLAMFVVYLNHLPMLADTPEAYRDQPGLEFLCRVPCNWDETRVLHAEFGNCLVVARRNGTAWYVGGMTGAAGRTLELPLSFLGDGAFRADFIEDDPAGPTRATTRSLSVRSADSLRVTIPAAGGFVATLTPEGE
ncbi:MAG: glycoside hydrolase family 97 protein [Planctomyces sp.]|nr:glycoside hydrolase family 97 protein [Planctomyces sp.]